MKNSNAKAPSGWLPFLRTLAGDAKLKFVIGKNIGAATDGKTVWLSEMPAELNEQDLILFKGDSFHEVGHIRYSNIPYFQAFSREHGSTAQFFLNALDDVFMEGEMSKWKRMAARYLRDSTVILLERNQYRDGASSLAEAVGCYCLTYLSAKRWSELQPAQQTVLANLRKHLGQHADSMISKLEALLDCEFPNVRSTMDCGELTLKILELFKDEAEQEQSDSESKPSDGTGEQDDDAEGSEEAESKEPQDTDEGNDDDSTGPNGSSETESESEPGTEGNESTDNTGSQDEADSDAGQAENSDGQNPTEDGSNGTGDEPSGDAGKSLKQLVQDMLNANPGDQEVFDKGAAVKALSEQIKNGTNVEYLDLPMVDQMVIEGAPIDSATNDFVDGMQVVEGDKEMASVISAITGRKANVMANKLRALLLNREETETYSTRNGRLCERNLYRFGLDDSRIFESSEERIEETAAVSITTDLSGSTCFSLDGTSVAEQLRIALTLLEKVLHEIGTPREILGFAPNSGQLNCVVRSFGDNHRVALERIAGLHRLVGGGCTPIGDAVFQAGTRLMCHEAQRKLLFVLTDGTPSSKNHAIEMTQYIAKSNIEVIYLVIGSSHACEWLEANNFKYAHAESAVELIPSLVAKVGEFLK